jgi:hypothetical protein
VTRSPRNEARGQGGTFEKKARRNDGSRERQHAPHADFPLAPRDRRVHRVHATENRTNAEADRHHQRERAQLIGDFGLPRVVAGLRNGVEPEPPVVLKGLRASGFQHYVERGVIGPMASRLEVVVISQDFRFAGTVAIDGPVSEVVMKLTPTL